MSETDYMIAEAVLDTDCDGQFDIDTELDGNMSARVCGWIETESHQEDDYYNGTGDRVTTYASVCISSLELHVYDDDGDEAPCTLEVHESEIEDYCREQLLSR